MVDGYAKIERLSFNAFNEATDFFSAVEGYRQEHGCYPQRILVDKSTGTERPFPGARRRASS